MKNVLEEQLKNFPYKIILGSASPRRQELLRSLGFAFTLSPTHADESFSTELSANEIPVYLAEKKANAYSKKLLENEILITADTVVWREGKIYNKPANFVEGKKMLSELSGKMHEVFTAVCLKGNKKQIIFFDTSRVYFKSFTEQEIEYYLTNFKPYDKAGAYGVQDWLGYVGIEKIEGSFYNVMGFPVKRVYEELIKF
jgi:septum formation protein